MNIIRLIGPALSAVIATALLFTGTSIFASTEVFAGGEPQFITEPVELRMDMGPTYLVAPIDGYNIELVKQLTLRFADVKITPKGSPDFSLMLYFKCDTPDLASFDSPEKMEGSVKMVSQKFLSGSVEKTADIKTLSPNGRYGYYSAFS